MGAVLCTIQLKIRSLYPFPNRSQLDLASVI